MFHVKREKGLPLKNHSLYWRRANVLLETLRRTEATGG